MNVQRLYGAHTVEHTNIAATLDAADARCAIAANFFSMQNFLSTLCHGVEALKCRLESDFDRLIHRAIANRSTSNRSLSRAARIVEGLG